MEIVPIHTMLQFDVLYIYKFYRAETITLLINQHKNEYATI